MACTLDEHRAEIAALLDPVISALGSETLPVEAADLPGRVTAAQLPALLPIPAFTNSQMDGYAARSAPRAASVNCGSSLPPTRSSRSRGTAGSDVVTALSDGSDTATVAIT